MTATSLGSIRIGPQGGETFVLELSEGLNFGEQARVRVVKMTSYDPLEFEAVADTINGRPGETEISDEQTMIYPATPFPDDPAQPKLRRFLRVYSPRLAPGVYYLEVLRRVGDGWVSQCIAAPGFRVLPALRLAQVYETRALFNAPTYDVGPRNSSEEPLQR